MADSLRERILALRATHVGSAPETDWAKGYAQARADAAARTTLPDALETVRVLAERLKASQLQLEYLHQKYAPTSTGEAEISRNAAVLAEMDAKETPDAE